MKSNSAKRILAALDLNGSKKERSRMSLLIDAAERLASSMGSRIDLLHVEDSDAYPGTTLSGYDFFRPFMKEFAADRKDQLRTLSGKLKNAGQPLLAQGSPVRGILDTASRRGAYEVVALGTRGRTGLQRFFMGSVAEDVLRSSRIPVMIVGPSVKRVARAVKPTILLATDLGPNSKRATDFAAELARRSGAAVHLFHCLYEGLHPVVQTALSTESGNRKLAGMVQDLRGGAEKKMSSQIAKLSALGITAHAQVDARGTNAADAILQAASKIGAQWIVMGTHGRNLAQSAFFGRTARDVILESPVPAIVVKSRG